MIKYENNLPNDGKESNPPTTPKIKSTIYISTLNPSLPPLHKTFYKAPITTNSQEFNTKHPNKPKANGNLVYIQTNTHPKL